MGSGPRSACERTVAGRDANRVRHGRCTAPPSERDRAENIAQLALADALQTYLADTPYPDEAALTEMDDRFIAENLSPGGSADLLALTYLLHFFRSEVIEDV